MSVCFFDDTKLQGFEAENVGKYQDFGAGCWLPVASCRIQGYGETEIQDATNPIPNIL